MKLEELKQQIDAVVYNRPAVIKANCPYVMTLSQRLSPLLWRWVVWFNDDFVVLVIPYRTKPDVIHELFQVMDELTTDWGVL